MVLIALAAGAVAWGGLVLLDDGRDRALAGQMTQLRRDATVMAALFAETASRVGPPDERGENRRVVDAGRAALLFGRVETSGVRLRLFDSSGRLVADSGTEAEVEVEPLSPIQQAYDDFARWLRSGADGDSGAAGAAVIARFPEAQDALQGEPGERIDQDEDGNATLIVAVPVWRDDAVMAALVAGSAAPAGTGEGLGNPQRLAAASAVAMVVLALGAVLLLVPLQRSVHRLAVAADNVLRRNGTAVPFEPGPGGLLAGLSRAVQRVADLLQARIQEAELFAREIAHEIKNPLSSLRSAVETASMIRDPEQHQRLMEVIVQDVARLDRLISAITDLSQVEAELAAMPDETVDLAAMAAAIVEIENAVSQGAWDPEFIVVSGDGPFRVQGVEARLAQVFRNVMSNARSFSPPGGRVRLVLTRRGNAITITCDDDGPGLPPGKEELIFGRFYSDRPDHHPFAGHSGLGLSFCRQIVTAHGGTIWAENRLAPAGHVIGARFTIVLPAA